MSFIIHTGLPNKCKYIDTVCLSTSVTDGGLYEYRMVGGEVDDRI